MARVWIFNAATVKCVAAWRANRTPQLSVATLTASVFQAIAATQLALLKSLPMLERQWFRSIHDRD